MTSKTTDKSEKTPKKKLRNLKLREARGDEKIFSAGFIIGGQRLSEINKTDSSKSSSKDKK